MSGGVDIASELTGREGTCVFTAPKCLLEVNGNMEPDGCGGGEELEEVCCPGTVIEGQALGGTADNK